MSEVEILFSLWGAMLDKFVWWVLIQRITDGVDGVVYWFDDTTIRIVPCIHVIISPEDGRNSNQNLLIRKVW
jgi:hypothetical protein